MDNISRNKMKLDYGKDFRILRLMGLFIGTMLCFRLYSRLSEYHTGMMNPFSVGDIIALSLSSLLALYFLTLYWRLELRPNKVISTYGFPLWRRTKLYTGIKSIDFKVDFIEVKDGPSKAYISVNLSVDGRSRPYPAFSLYQVRDSMFFLKEYFHKKHNNEFLKFKGHVNKLRYLYPKVPITLDQKVESFYKYLTSEDFPWR
jgi:hypothetical protein